MHRQQDDFLTYMAFRDSVLEDKIEQCLSAACTGADSISIDRENLSDRNHIFKGRSFDWDMFTFFYVSVYPSIRG